MNKVRVLFKTKGSHEQGIGDVTSSIALAEKFRSQGYDIHFIINNNKNVIDFVSGCGFKSNLAQKVSEIDSIVREVKFDIAILNQLNTPEIEADIFRRHVKLLVTIEDTGSSARMADLRFNVLYPISEAYTDLSFIPLADTFQRKHVLEKRVTNTAGVILIIQGGSDTYGFTPKIIKALYSLPDSIAVDVIIGPNFSHYAELDQALKSAPRAFTIVKDRDDLSDIMLKADLAVSAGGYTLFELACLGIPTIVVCGDTFEEPTAQRMQKEGFGINLGFGKNVTSEEILKSLVKLMNNVDLRRKMSSAGKRLIDGRGATRIAAAITERIL